MLHVEKISKHYTTGEYTQTALDKVTISFRKNEFAAILGHSGSGKTTFLNIIGGLDRYDEGDLLINGRSTKDFKDQDWDAYRNNSVGFIFQNYHLIPHLSITDNVMLGLALSGESPETRRKKAIEVLTRVGLKEHIHKKPNQLSGGQMQRVAIARALANDPDIILADEPTGALDTETSIQVLNLIKEIAKDKLVIMVTHNPSLAGNYADRIIEFQDGKVISDSNPYQADTNFTNYKLKRTGMGFGTALKLSYKNIRTKLFRTLLTSFASSIGIIGIALILSLSNGFDKQIAKFESDTLSGFPIIISRQTEKVDIDTLMGIEKKDDDKYPDRKEVIPYDPEKDQKNHTNKLSRSYLDFLEKMNPEWLNGIAYARLVNLNLIRFNGAEPAILRSEAVNLSTYPVNPDKNRPGYLQASYDLLAGRYPETMHDLIMVTDEYNRVNKSILEELGLPADVQGIPFKDILGLELKAIPNDLFYKQKGEIFICNREPENLKELYNHEKAITLKITGIVRPARKTEIPVLQPGITFPDELNKFFMEDAKESAIVKAQQKAEYNVLTGEVFRSSHTVSTGNHSFFGRDLTGSPLGLGSNPFGSQLGGGIYQSQIGSEKDTILACLGADGIPYMITVYPVDFEFKELVLNYLNAWNDNKKTEEKIVVTDLGGTITDLTSGIMRAITLVLIAFAATSLIVSLIMIGIITYISVLERTAEIGILRALGARKKDISRVFNAETFLIGAASGGIGVLTGALLTIPVNSTLYRLTHLENVAQLNVYHGILLAAISIALTMLGGFLPAIMAANKDPAAALQQG
ncbi:MAG: ATP-binding cassette domain-containing protein [Caldicoprobacterales bacterium]